MKAILLTFVLIFSLSILYAQYSTPNTGVNWNMDSLVVHSNGVVIGSFGEYSILNELTLSENDSLIITNAETISIDDPSIIVYFFGYFSATNSTGLLITPNPDSYFGGLRFEASSTALLTHVTIQYGGGIKVITSNFSMDSCTVQYFDYSFNTGAAIEVSNGQPIITNSSFISNERAAISSAANAEVSPYIAYNTFAYNNTSNSNRPQINLGPSGATDTTRIIGNIIEGDPLNDQAGGIAFSSLLGIDGNVIIADNEVFNNRYGIAIIGNGINALISNNTCMDNNTQGDPMLGGSGLNFNATLASTAIVKGNEISGNLWGITVQGSFSINMGDGSDESPGQNIFSENGNGGETYALYNNTNIDISALDNCWDGLQSITLEEAEDVIFHQEDDVSLGLVSFDPMWDCGFGVGIDEHDEIALLIYPNPANNELFIKSNEEWDELRVYSISGRLMKMNKIQTESPSRLDLNEISPGIYILELSTKNKKVRSRVVKQK